MGTLGSYLRDARESLGADLREASQETRIALNFLKAIEEDQFSKLPGEVFVKGFLKNYARFLRLPEEEVMRRYAERAAPAPAAPAANKRAAVPAAPPAPAEAAPHRVPEQPAAQPSRAPRIELYLVAGGIVIAVIALLLVVLPSRHPARERGAPAPPKAAPAPASLLTSTLTATRGPDKLYLDIIALEDLWILVRTDTSPQKKAVLKQGETVTWTADERFVLSYGGAGAVKIVLNGKELAVPAGKDAVVRDLTITAGGIAGHKIEQDQPKPKKPQPGRPAEVKPQQTTPAPGAPRTPAADQSVPQTVPAPAAAPTATAAAAAPIQQSAGAIPAKLPWE
jgi:hypothetical protein